MKNKDIHSITSCILSVVICISFNACLEDAPYYYAQKVTGQTFSIYHEDIGIHPNQQVLQDPHNPFARFSIGAETRWFIQSAGDPVTAFYSWASILTVEATGEHQFYVALNLQDIYEKSRASTDDLPYIRALAIRAFQNVLDTFPTAVTFDRTGKIPYGLATPAYQGIIELGGVPKGGWSLLSNEEGIVYAVKTSDPPRVELDE